MESSARPGRFRSQPAPSACVADYHLGGLPYSDVLTDSTERRSSGRWTRRPLAAAIMSCSHSKSTRTERYRSGRNGGASKASCRVTGTWVRIPPSPPPSVADAPSVAARAVFPLEATGCARRYRTESHPSLTLGRWRLGWSPDPSSKYGAPLNQSTRHGSRRHSSAYPLGGRASPAVRVERKKVRS